MNICNYTNSIIGIWKEDNFIHTSILRINI